MITADTITDEQIRELLTRLNAESHAMINGDPLMRTNRDHAHECRVAVGITRSGYAGGKRAARARCAEILNARAQAERDARCGCDGVLYVGDRWYDCALPVGHVGRHVRAEGKS